MTTITIKAYRGGESGQWFTSDRDHASCFGDVRKYTLQFDADDIEHISADDIVGDLSGYDADEILHSYLEESGKFILAIEGWEGNGTCYLIDEDIIDVEISNAQ